MLFWACFLGFIAGDDYFHDPWAKGKIHTTTIETAQDPSIQVVAKGKAGNMELRAAGTPQTGSARVNYQKGFGFVEYDHQLQTLTFEGSRRFSFNRTSKKVMRTAPYVEVKLPTGAVVDLDVHTHDLGYGSFDFRDLSVSRLVLDVNYGDIDFHFPTENTSVIRDEVLFHLMAGDLELEQLGNLKASKIKINGGVGELSLDFGPQLRMDTDVSFDHDIGRVDVSIPKGTHVIVKGTNRNLQSYNLDQVGTYWETTNHASERPILTLDMRGPIGGLDIQWK